MSIQDHREAVFVQKRCKAYLVGLRGSFVSALVATMELGRFGIDPSRGFLPLSDPPLGFDVNPDVFLKELEETGKRIPELLESQKVRSVVEALPLPDLTTFDRLREKEVVAAARVYAFLASAYVHQIGQETATRLPRSVALPSSSFLG